MIDNGYIIHYGTHEQIYKSFATFQGVEWLNLTEERFFNRTVENAYLGKFGFLFFGQRSSKGARFPFLDE